MFLNTPIARNHPNQCPACGQLGFATDADHEHRNSARILHLVQHAIWRVAHDATYLPTLPLPGLYLNQLSPESGWTSIASVAWQLAQHISIPRILEDCDGNPFSPITLTPQQAVAAVSNWFELHFPTVDAHFDDPAAQFCGREIPFVLPRLTCKQLLLELLQPDLLMPAPWAAHIGQTLAYLELDASLPPENVPIYVAGETSIFDGRKARLEWKITPCDHGVEILHSLAWREKRQRTSKILYRALICGPETNSITDFRHRWVSESKDLFDISQLNERAFPGGYRNFDVFVPERFSRKNHWVSRKQWERLKPFVPSNITTDYEIPV